jgi:hypothetical protein
VNKKRTEPGASENCSICAYFTRTVPAPVQGARFTCKGVDTSSHEKGRWKKCVECCRRNALQKPVPLPNCVIATISPGHL